jgi:hypothetical protein
MLDASSSVKARAGSPAPRAPVARPNSFPTVLWICIFASRIERAMRASALQFRSAGTATGAPTLSAIGGYPVRDRLLPGTGQRVGAEFGGLPDPLALLDTARRGRCRGLRGDCSSPAPNTWALDWSLRAGCVARFLSRAVNTQEEAAGRRSGVTGLNRSAAPYGCCQQRSPAFFTSCHQQ